MNAVLPPETTGTPEVTESTRIMLHPLSVRQDGESWIIGRKEIGVFIAVTATAHRAVTLLSEGRTVRETARVLKSETGTSLAVSDFVTSLDDLAFIASIDGEARVGPNPPRQSFPWLRPQHVRWFLNPILSWLISGVVIAAVVMIATHPALMPAYRNLVWCQYSGIVLAVNAALGWAIMGLHELGHLITARAADVPARVTLGTRLQFLAVQTDVSGVWTARRRHRMTVYLAGLAINLLIASICVLVEGLASPDGLARQMLALTAMESLLFLPVQFSVFMRTDMYFVLQDLTGCANLYADGTAHLRYLAYRIIGSIRRDYNRPVDPAQALADRERRAIHAYSWLLLSGTITCIAVAVLVSTRVTLILLVRGVRELAGGSVLNTADGVAALIAISFFWVLWLSTWWRRHRSQLAQRLGIRKGTTS